MADINYRYGAEADLSKLYELFRSVVEPFELYDPRSRREELKKYTPEKLRAMLQDDEGSVILGLDDSKIVGFVITRYDEGPIWLCWFATDPAYRKRGVGSRLISETIARAKDRGVHKIWCDTRAENFDSIPILEAHGFERKCELRNHWWNQDYLLWERFI